MLMNYWHCLERKVLKLKKSSILYYGIISIAIVFMARTFVFGEEKPKMNYVEVERATADGVFYTPKPISFPSAEISPSQKPLKAAEFAQIETKTRKSKKDTFEKISVCKWPTRVQKEIAAICKKEKISFPLLMALAWEESTFRLNVTNNDEESVGPFQIQPKWNKSTMDKFGYERSDLFDAVKGARVAAHILRSHFNRLNDVEFVLMAYNGGGEYAMRNIDNGIVSEYAKEILEKASEFEN